MASTDRRAKWREATLQEIRATARRLLVTHGTAAVTFNAIAREMGFSGPAMYRYYASHDELIGALTQDFYRELTAAIREARDAHAGQTPQAGILAMCRTMRGWAVAHRAEFGWIFASRIPAPGGPRTEAVQDVAGSELGHLFLALVAEVWEARRFPVPELGRLAPSMRRQLQAYAAKEGGRLPPQAMHVFLACWIRLYGLLCMEVFGQLSFAYTDMEPVFEECLQALCAALGVGYTPPASPT